jgi:hypothetical protein
MDGHVGAASAEVPTGRTQIGSTAMGPKNIAIGVAGQRITRALDSHVAEDARLIESASATRDVGPDLQAAKTFAASVGATRDVRHSDHAWRLAGFDSFVPVWRYRFRCHVAWRRGRPVLRQPTIAHTTSRQDKKG